MTIDKLLNSIDRSQQAEEKRAAAQISALMGSVFAVLLERLLAEYRNSLNGDRLRSRLALESRMRAINQSLIAPSTRQQITQIFLNRFQSAARTGHDLAYQLLEELGEGDRPQSRTEITQDYLQQRAIESEQLIEAESNRFASRALAILGGAIALGLGQRIVRRQLKQAYGRVVGHTQTVVDYESMTLLNLSLTEVYERQSINLVQLRSQEDESVCPICTARNRLVYGVSDISVPLHPRCRCYLVPFTEGAVRSGAIDRAAEQRIRTEWLDRATRVDYGLSPSEKYAGREKPPNAQWIP